MSEKIIIKFKRFSLRTASNTILFGITWDEMGIYLALGPVYIGIDIRKKI